MIATNIPIKDTTTPLGNGALRPDVEVGGDSGTEESVSPGPGFSPFTPAFPYATSASPISAARFSRMARHTRGGVNGSRSMRTPTAS